MEEQKSNEEGTLASHPIVALKIMSTYFCAQVARSCKDPHVRVWVAHHETSGLN